MAINKKILFSVKGKEKEIYTDDLSVTDEKLREWALKVIESMHRSPEYWEYMKDVDNFWITHAIISN